MLIGNVAVIELHRGGYRGTQVKVLLFYKKKNSMKKAIIKFTQVRGIKYLERNYIEKTM